MLQRTAVLSRVLLRSRVLCRPLVGTLRHGYVPGLLLPDLAMPGAGAGYRAHCLAEAQNLVENDVAHLANVINDFEVEVEGGGAVGLIRGIVPDL